MTTPENDHPIASITDAELTALRATALTGVTTERLVELREKAQEAWRAAEIEVQTTSLLLLARRAREAYGDDAVYLVLGHSDQGDFMDFESVLDADFDDLVIDDEEIDEFEDEDVAAWDLPQESSYWQAFAADGGRSQHGGPAWFIDIARVLAQTPFEDPKRPDFED